MTVPTTFVPAFACGRCGQLLDNTDGTLRVDDVTVCAVDALDALVVHAAEAIGLRRMTEYTARAMFPPPAPIKGAMTQPAPGCGAHVLIGRTIVTTYEVPDESDRTLLLLLDNGQTIVICVDIGYQCGGGRDPDVHEVCMFDATDTPAGRIMPTLTPGEWT